ncbi:hypothetical protein VCHA53O466_40251 [Vibrio chagasii]|nr:hypothetical protein VCHA53O466_40251 [Vibrio chagasii]
MSHLFLLHTYGATYEAKALSNFIARGFDTFCRRYFRCLS